MRRLVFALYICILSISASAQDISRTVVDNLTQLNIDGTVFSATLHTLKGSVPDTLLFLQHGYQRAKENLGTLADSLATEHLAILTMTLTDHQMGSESFAQKVAGALVEMQTEILDFRVPSKILVVGHSIGASFASAVGMALEKSHEHLLQGIFLIDPVEKNGLLRKSINSISKLVPVFSIFGEGGMCNMGGSALKTIHNSEMLSLNLRLTHGTHCDAEGESTNWLCQSMCGRSRPQNVSNLRELLGAWTSGLSDGGIFDDYNAGGKRLIELERQGSLSIL